MSQLWLGVLLALVTLVPACERASRLRRKEHADAAVRVDATPAPVPVPDAAPVAPDAAPPAADAGPRPRPPRRLDGCETDADCTTYGDPCGGGIFPVNRLNEERAVARAQKRCPGENMAYLIAIGSTRTRCVQKRCRMANALDSLGTP